jgi:hypothetical protein
MEKAVFMMTDLAGQTVFARQRGFLLMVFMFVCLATAGVRAQTGNDGGDAPVIYVLDGEHTSFAYGRVIASNKIAIGLTREGTYELRDDMAVWLVDHPDRQDEPVCRIIDDFTTGNKLFVTVAPDEQMTPIDTLCACNPSAGTVLDRAGNVTGILQTDGSLVSPQGKTLLLNLQSVDKLLAAFFFSCHYTSVRKQLKFSAMHVAGGFYPSILRAVRFCALRTMNNVDRYGWCIVQTGRVPSLHRVPGPAMTQQVQTRRATSLRCTILNRAQYKYES